ncbi:MAG: ABC transporter permease [Nitrospirae bacterium]|nr:ABC transporter permease [Nitrospirota bacterium]
MHLTGRISASVLILIFVMSLLSPHLTPYDPDAVDLNSLREPPSVHHFLGTDNKGRDILTRILFGAKISIGIALVASCLSVFMGLFIGIISGYFRGLIDTLLMAVVDLILSFPSLLLAIGISVLFPPGIYTVVISLSAVGWASFARLTRGHVLSLRESSFIEAAEAIGCSHLRTVFVHILPQCIPLSIVYAGMKLGGVILTEASLSFLGLGAPPPTATWGSMISSNRAFISSAPWMVFSPGIMITVTTLCFNFLGDGLREKYDSRRDTYHSMKTS